MNNLVSALVEHWQVSWKERPIYFLLAMGLLVPNYVLETWKWKKGIEYVGTISWAEALGGVLKGMALGFITPHSVGDYAGRILGLPVAWRAKAIFPLFWGRFSLYVVTLCAGTLGAIYMWSTALLQNQWLVYFYYGCIVMVFVLVLIYVFGKEILKKILVRALHVIWKKLFSSEPVPTSFGFHFFIVWLSGARYLVFLVQYVWLIRFVGGTDPWLPLLAGIALVFLAKSTLPTFNFMSDLGVREASALFFLSFSSLPSSFILMASLILWLINVLIPTIIGAIWVTWAKWKWV